VRADDARALSADTIVVYPTALKAESVLRARVARGGVLLGHRVTTFPELTDTLAADLGVASRVIDPDLAVVVLARALERRGMPDGLGTGQGGVLRELMRVVAELEAAYLAPDEVAEVAAALGPGPAGARLAALARVYAAYEQELARVRAVDRHGRERLVCEALAAATAPPPALAGVRRVVFAEIYDFSVLQFLIATSLIRLVGDAELVAFAHPENVDATRFLDRTWNRFVGDPTIADRVLPSFVARGGRQGNVSAVLRGVFARERPASVPPDGSVRVVVAPSRYREVEDAIRDVRRRLARPGADPERIAILARDLQPYRELIADVCRRYRVPVYFRKGPPLLASALVRTCLNLLRCAAEGLPRVRLAALLESDYFRRPAPGLARLLAEIGFVADRARPLTECLAHEGERLRAEAADARLPFRRRAAAARRAARLEAVRPGLTAFAEAVRALDARRPVEGHVRALRRTLRRLGLRRAASGEPGPATRRDAAGWAQLERTLVLLDGLAEALALEPRPLDDFVRLLVAALEPQAIEDGAPATGSIRALSVLDARGLDFDVVYLLGLDDGSFPSPHGESPLWPDAMKRAANAPAARVLRRKLGARAAGLPLGGLFRTAREASLEDPFLFFLGLSMAEDEIVLSYPAVNEQGNPTVESPFVEEVRACVADLPTRVLEATALVPPLAECAEVPELLGRAALDRWAPGAGAAPDRLGPALAAALPDGPARLAALDARARIEERRGRFFLAGGDEKTRLAAGDLGPWIGRLAAPPAPLPARLRALAWSPTLLNDLGACGFKFFAKHVLGLARADEPDLEVDPRERGRLVHAVLEELFGRHPVLPADLAAARALGRELVAAARARAVARIAAKDPALLDVAWDLVGTFVDEVIVLEHAEQVHRPPDVRVTRLVEEPLEHGIADGDGVLRIGGRPDRVDVHWRDGRVVLVRVLDYKASRDRAGHLRKLDPERDLLTVGFQVPVYLLGARSAVGPLAPDAVLDGGYVLLREAGRKLATRTFDEAVLERVVARVRALVARAEAAHFDVDPAVCDPSCDYRAVCRYQPPPLEDEATPGA